MVVPDKNVAPKSLPVRSCMVRMAKSMFMAFMLPSGLPIPETLAWRVLNIKFLKLCDSSTKRWSMPICLKSVTSSVRSFISCSSFSSLASRFSFLLSSPFFIQPLTSLPCCSNTARFSSILSISCVYISCCISGDWGIFPNWSCVRMMQSQLLFLMSWNIPTRFSGVKSSLPGYSTLAFG